MQGDKLLELVTIPLLVGLAGTILYLRFEKSLKALVERKPAAVTGIAAILLAGAVALIYIPPIQFNVRQTAQINIQQSMSIWRAAALGTGIILYSLIETTLRLGPMDARQMAIATLLAPIRVSNIMGSAFAVYKLLRERSLNVQINSYTMTAVGLLATTFIAANSLVERWIDNNGQPTQRAKLTVVVCTAVNWACVIIVIWQ